MSEPQGRERRKLKRHGSLIPALYKSGSLNGKGHIKNLSKEGLFMRTDRLPPPSAPVRILIQPPDGRRIEVSGTVRWTTDQYPIPSGKSGFGMYIDVRSDAFMELFRELLLN